MFKRILVPIDGSPDSYRGLRLAVDIAKEHESEITFIHVVERPVFFYAGMGNTIIPAEVYTGLEDHAKKLFSKRKKELTEKGVRTKTLLKRGDPAVQILKASRGFDLIVMGSRGLGRFKRYFLGSVSNSVVQQSKVPVLIVKPEN
jgi:nucleotide-binding universal stress UspA family protein